MCYLIFKNVTRNRKCGHDPAVRVQHVAGDVGRYAVDGVANEIVRCDLIEKKHSVSVSSIYMRKIS